MGLFDMFGAGGGSVQIQPTSPHVASGSAIAGNLVFMGGKRAQNVTKLTLRMTMEQRTMQMTNQGMQPQTNARDIVPATVIAQMFSTTPGQPSTFPFQFPVPPGLPSSTPGSVTFHLRASADIDGEVDPGASLEVQVVGTGPAAMPGAMPGMMPNNGMGGMPGMMPNNGMGMPNAMGGAMGGMPNAMGGMPNAMGGMPGAVMGAVGMAMGGMPNAMGGAMGGMPGAMPGMMPNAMGGMPGAMPGAMPGVMIANGTRVMAQWTDGQFHPGHVRGFENGAYRIDWDEARLVATSYVYPQQIQVSTGPAPGMAGMGPGMGPGMHAPQHQQMQAKGHDMHGKGGHDPYAAKGGHDPYAAKGGHDPYAAKGGHDPHAKGMGSVGHPPSVGSAVMAQHPNNHQWYPARVAAMQNGMVGVDWDDPNLGQSTWVAPTAVRGR
jgi:hypothetical protein